MSGSLTQPLHELVTPRGEVGGQQYRSADCWPALDVPGDLLQRVPTAGLWVPGSYASVWDLVVTSLPEDSRYDFDAAGIRQWLLIGAGQVNEHLFNRGWPVPLTAWSITVVWANCELAYVGLYRKRGGNTQGDWQNFVHRERAVFQWLNDAQDKLITPDPRPSLAGQGHGGFRYNGERKRAWDAPCGYLGFNPARRFR